MNYRGACKPPFFLPSRINPLTPNRRYLQCPTTGQCYCLTTGSLYHMTAPIMPLSTNMQLLLQNNFQPALFLQLQINHNTEQAIKTHNNKPKSNNPVPPIQSNKIPLTKCESNLTYEINHVAQGNSTSSTCSRSPNFPANGKKKEKINLKGNQCQPTQSKKLTTLASAENKPPLIKSESSLAHEISLSVHVSSTSTCTQSNNAPTKKKKTKAKKAKTKTQKTASTNSIKSSASGSADKLTVSFKKKCSIDDETIFPLILNVKRKSTTTTTTTTKLSRPRISYPYNPYINPKKKSYIYYVSALLTRPKQMKPLQIDLSFPQRRSLLDSVKLREGPKASGMPHGIDFSIPQRKPLFDSLKLRQSPPNFEMPHDIWLSEEDECAIKSPDALALYFSSKYDGRIGGKSNIKHKTTKRKTFAHVTKKDNSDPFWRFLAPFNRRARPKRSSHYHGKEPVWAKLCKNCILASSVHDIIHSKFKNLNELMPVSKLQALLNAGHRKIIPNQQWMRCMEQEAIHQYKKLKFEQYKEMVEVVDFNTARHPEKPWLAGCSRRVIHESDEKDWPLLVKCLYKYPDSTIRYASKHRSFCLRWNETSYTLRNDHAYYTQIQCQMAITNTLYAELLVHTRKETAVVRVLFNADFWKATESKLETFFTHYVLPYMKKNRIEPHLPKDLFQPDSIVSLNSKDVLLGNREEGPGTVL